MVEVSWVRGDSPPPPSFAQPIFTDCIRYYTVAALALRHGAGYPGTGTR